MPLITAIITTYRRPQLLKRALSSVLNQTFPQIQVCVYDNASGDETKAVVDEWIKKDSRVKYHCHSNNIGMMENYEYALQQVKTPFFSILSDDDVILPWFYEEGLRALKAYPNAAFFAGSTILMTEAGKVVRVPLDLWKREGYYCSSEGSLELISKYPVPTAVLFQKNVICEIPIDKKNPLMWDCDFLIQIASRYSFIISKKPCGIFLHHQTSYSGIQSLEEWETAQDCLQKRVSSSNAISDAVKNRMHDLMDHDLRNTHRAFALNCLFAGNFNQAIKFATIYRKKYGLSLTSMILLLLSKLCSCLPYALPFLLWARRIKKKLQKEKGKHPYQEYAKWLQH